MLMVLVPLVYRQEAPMTPLRLEMRNLTRWQHTDSGTAQVCRRAVTAVCLQFVTKVRGHTYSGNALAVPEEDAYDSSFSPPALYAARKRSAKNSSSSSVE